MHTLPSTAFGALETSILQLFWAQDGTLTVRDIHHALRDRRLAYTTIMTTMVRMAEKGWLGRVSLRLGTGGRGVAYAYTVGITRSALLAAAIEEACARRGADHGDRAAAMAILAQ